MMIKRNLTSILLFTSLGLGMGLAALSPSEAVAGDSKHKSSDKYDCNATPTKKIPGPARARFVKACNDAKVKTYGDMKHLMKDWKNAAKGKEIAGIEIKNCKSCHTDANGMEGTKDEAYKALDGYMSAGGVK